MAPSRKDRFVETNHAKIWVLDSLLEDNDHTRPLILLLHGNSFCSEIWKHFFASDLANKHRILAFDLPGHGESADATNAERTYNMPGYADVALQVLSRIEASGPLIVVGWSLGGHVALEMLLRCSHIRGVVITGTPPVDTPDEIDKAFTFGPGGWRSAIAARASISEEELQAFARGCADPPYEAWMERTVRRTDGRARELMFKHFAGGKADPVDLEFRVLQEPKMGQKQLVETSEIPIAVINGKNEPFINLGWIRNIMFKNLWRGDCIEMDGLLHAPFWAKPDEYLDLLRQFINDVS